MKPTETPVLGPEGLELEHLVVDRHRVCERVIFAERLEEMAAYVRKTDRLRGALSLIGFAPGGRAGARLAKELDLP